MKTITYQEFKEAKNFAYKISQKTIDYISANLIDEFHVSNDMFIFKRESSTDPSRMIVYIITILIDDGIYYVSTDFHGGGGSRQSDYNTFDGNIKQLIDYINLVVTYNDDELLKLLSNTKFYVGFNNMSLVKKCFREGYTKSLAFCTLNLTKDDLYSDEFKKCVGIVWTFLESFNSPDPLLKKAYNYLINDEKLICSWVSNFSIRMEYIKDRELAKRIIDIHVRNKVYDGDYLANCIEFGYFDHVSEMSKNVIDIKKPIMNSLCFPHVLKEVLKSASISKMKLTDRIDIIFRAIEGERTDIMIKMANGDRKYIDKEQAIKVLSKNYYFQEALDYKPDIWIFLLRNHKYKEFAIMVDNFPLGILDTWFNELLYPVRYNNCAHLMDIISKTKFEFEIDKGNMYDLFKYAGDSARREMMRNKNFKVHLKGISQYFDILKNVF
jgi:hypothetical protein